MQGLPYELGKWTFFGAIYLITCLLYTSVERLKKEFEPQGIKVFPISGVTGAGIKELLYYVSTEIEKLDVAPIIFEPEY